MEIRQGKTKKSGTRFEFSAKNYLGGLHSGLYTKWPTSLALTTIFQSSLCKFTSTIEFYDAFHYSSLLVVFVNDQIILHLHRALNFKFEGLYKSTSGALGPLWWLRNLVLYEHNLQSMNSWHYWFGWPTSCSNRWLGALTQQQLHSH